MTVTKANRSDATARVSTARASTAAMELKGSSSDPGIKMKFDEKNGRVFIKGTAEGPQVKYLEGDAFVGGKKEKLVDYQVARGASFEVDKGTMPDFSKDADYTNKNKWYFAHLATVDTQKGWSAKEVAGRLAESINKGGAFKATVTVLDGGASIQLKRN